MKKTITLTLFAIAALLTWQSACPLEPFFPPGSGNGRRFTKTITNNVRYYDENGKPVYDLSEKGLYDKMFFGFTNSPIEYTVLSGYLFSESDCGLRLYRDEIDSLWRLEVIPKGNYSTEIDAIDNEIKEIKIPWDYFNYVKTGRAETVNFKVLERVWQEVPKEVSEKIHEHNRQAYEAEQDEATYISRRPKTTIVTVGCLGGLLYEKFVSVIANFKSEGPPAMIMDGTFITFRCVVGEELWELGIEEPNGQVGRMSSLCSRIIKDVSENGSLDEDKYIAELESINP
jgi:hypothetical protein